MVGSSALRALEPWPDDVEVATPKGKRTYSIIELQTFHERGDLEAS